MPVRLHEHVLYQVLRSGERTSHHPGHTDKTAILGLIQALQRRYWHTDSPHTHLHAQQTTNRDSPRTFLHSGRMGLDHAPTTDGRRGVNAHAPRAFRFSMVLLAVAIGA